MTDRLALRDVIVRCYRHILQEPVAMIAVVLTLSAFAAYNARQFTFDASSDTLIVENDPNLAYYNHTIETFGESTFVVLTYTPRTGDLFDAAHLAKVAQLQQAISSIAGVRQTVSLLDVPLLKSPPAPLSELAESYTTIGNGTAELALARDELTDSPLFREMLISGDGRTAVIRIDLEDEKVLDELRIERDVLRRQRDLSDQQVLELEKLENAYFQLKESYNDRREQLIEAIRRVRDRNDDNATIYLGGVPMVAADMITFVRGDTLNFGAGILTLIALSLWFFFRKLRWVLIPIATTGITLLITVGILGYLEEAVTVISSSFVSLVAIITISFNVHLIVRYRELRVTNFPGDQLDLVLETMISKLAPCVYTALTTMVAFGSLLTSGIQPVTAFGWMMCLGIVVSFVVTYLFFACVLVLLAKGETAVNISRKLPLTAWLRDLSVSSPRRLLQGAMLLALLSVIGMTRLSLDNRFVEYFKSGTEIREGMNFIDQSLGGTLPLDIVIALSPWEPFDETFDDDFGEAEEVFPEKYWFTPDKVRLLEAFHAFLESKPEIGKLVSLSNLERAARDFNDGKPLGPLEIVYTLEAIPEEMRRTFIAPYASPVTGELRISARIHETAPGLSRDDLIAEIERFGVEALDLAPEQINVTGMTVLFNDMLKQMFNSQASTIGFVLLATFIMFSVLLRSVKLGLVGIAPNVIAPLTVLGFMGFVGLPLDMMTITISAIVIGIGVDDAIHYLHRFRDEQASGASTEEAIVASHGSIGSAMYFTSLTIIFGFSVLTLSNFIPTVYFGLLTALAMGLAMLVNLTVLPALLLTVYRDRTAGPQGSEGNE